MRIEEDQQPSQNRKILSSQTPHHESHFTNARRSRYNKVRMKVDSDTRRIAKQRIETLFKLANVTMQKDRNLAQRYADAARRIAMASKIRLPTEYRRRICKHCKSFILPGVNCTVRLQQRREPHVVVTCQECGEHMRIPTTRKQEKQVT